MSFGGSPERAASRHEHTGLPLFFSKLESRINATAAAAIQEKDFADLYGEQAVQKDMMTVVELESAFEKNDKAKNREGKENVVWGHAVEAFLHDQINSNNFFGEGAVGIKTSRFDDYRNGVDELVVFSRKEGVSHLGLSVDFTFADSSKKVAKIIENLKRGHKTVVKYCRVNVPGWDFRGELATPKVVVSVSREGLRDALAQWAGGEQDKLSSHPLQMLILRQIADQLDVYEKFAPQNMQAHYRSAWQTANDLIEERRKAGIYMGDLRKDSSHLALMNTLGGLLGGHH